MDLDKLTIDDLMSVARLVAHAPDSASRARLQMRDADVRHLPVVDNQFRLIGIVSGRHRRRRRLDPTLRVGDGMTRRVCAVRPDETARAAAELMLERRVGALPVIDADRRLLGIISETDFVRALLRNGAA